jgi:hypothetical protein
MRLQTTIEPRRWLGPVDSRLLLQFVTDTRWNITLRHRNNWRLIAT